MATYIYIPVGDFANPPTRKLWHDLRVTWPQLTVQAHHLTQPFEYPTGFKREPGVVIKSNMGGVDPGTGQQVDDPDKAAIIAAAIAHDGVEHPPTFGRSIPLVQTPDDLPDQPTTLGDNIAMLAATVNPVGLHAYARGQWRKLI